MGFWSALKEAFDEDEPERKSRIIKEENYYKEVPVKEHTRKIKL